MQIPPNLLALARHHRKNATDAEKLLWRLLRDRQCAGVKFRRQYAFKHYILDFYAPDRRLCIELDGGQHGIRKHEARDRERTAVMNAEQIEVLRCWNNDVLVRTEDVLQSIWEFLQEKHRADGDLEGMAQQAERGPS